MIDLNAVAIFVGVVEAGSFTGGAKALGLPKGSVSRKISSLEASLGVRLLHRTTRKLALTDVGRRYYDRCRSGLSELDAAWRFVDQVRAAPSGVLRIAAPADFGNGGLGDWVEAYLRRYEHAKVEVMLSDGYVDLIEQRIDLAFRSGKLDDSSLIARRLGPARRIVCGSPDYLDRRGVPAHPQELREHDCLLYGGKVEGETWHLQGPDGQIAVPVSARLAGDRMGFLLEAARGGLGLALLPEAIVRADLAAERLIRVVEPYATAETGIYAVYPSNRQVSANVRAFLDIVLEVTQRTSPWRPQRS